MKYLIFLFSFLVLTSCGSVSEESGGQNNNSVTESSEKLEDPIDIENPAQTAQHFKEILNKTEDVEQGTEEYFEEIRDVYTVGENVVIILNSEDEIEQINFNDIDRTEITTVLESIEFPITDSIKEFLQKTEPEENDMGESFFTNYKDTGVSLTLKGKILKKVQGNKDFSLILVYNPDRFEVFKNR